MQPIQFGGLTVGGGSPLLLIAGPCVIESEAHAVETALAVRDIARRAGVPYVFKASYDKANRTSGRSFRGPGLDEGLRVLGRVREAAGVPVLTDIHEPAQAAPAAEVADVLQIPAFLSRQTDLLVAAARTGRVVNIKKGQFLAPADMRHAIEKVTAAGTRASSSPSGASASATTISWSTCACSRFCGRSAIRSSTTSPTACSFPARETASRRVRPQFIEPMASAGVAAGVDGVFMEVHERPEQAKSDAQNALRLDLLEPLLTPARPHPRHRARQPRHERDADRSGSRAPGPAHRSCRHPGPRRAHRRRVRARRPDAVRVPRPRDRHRHGEVRDHLPEDRGHALEHRHVRLVPASRRGHSWRPRGHPRGRRRAGAVAQRRDRRTDPAARIHPANRRTADCADRRPANQRSPGLPTSRSTAALRRKPAR